MRNISRIFIYVGDLLTRITPSMALSLKQSGMDKEYNITAREYLAVAFTNSLIMGLLSGAAITLALSTGTKQFAKLGPILGFFVGLLNYIQLVSYPQAIVNKRVKDLEKNLLFALRTILVQIRSGIPIFDTFVSIASGNYGQISEEFRRVIDKARSGKPVLDSLEELAVRNPSMYFRRAIWQMVNAMRSGSDIGENLECVINALAKEQMVQIKEYQSTLNPLAMDVYDDSSHHTLAWDNGDDCCINIPGNEHVRGEEHLLDASCRRCHDAVHFHEHNKIQEAEPDG